MLLPVAAMLATLTLLQTQPAPTVDAVPRARAVLAAIGANDFAAVEAQFTPEMTAALPPGRLAALWTALQAKAGVYKTCSGEPRVVSIAGKQMVITRCEFERTTIDVQFAFDATGRISGFTTRPVAGPAVAYSLPSYASPGSFTEREITVGTGDWPLPATLTVPSSGGARPAVVLVHGSGPNDRDETIGANRPFKDLALGLASRGIAVLRYDKRTRVHAGRMAAVKNLTVDQEVVDDALGSVKILRSTPGIDGSRVFVLGHSLGGVLIPRIAARDPAIAGFIVLAGAARPLEEAIVAQTRYLAAADGTITPDEQQQIDRATAIASRVGALQAEDAASLQRISGAPASYWLDLRGYDAPSAAQRIKAPMLILQGDRDYQVTLDDFARWKTALESRRDVAFHRYPALNHLFMAGSGPSLPAEYLQPGHVAEEVIRDIAAWIQDQRP